LILSESEEAQQPKSDLKKKVKSDEESSKSPGGFFIGSKTIDDEAKKHPPSDRKVTPAVIVQNDVYSYDILNGN
jgi:hypothetical protein